MKARNIAADLHNHSTASDGEYSPSELVIKGRAAGLEAIALTDHDTISGLDEFVEAGKRAGIDTVPGVEVTLRFKRPLFVGSLHLLIYFSENLLADPGFRQALTAVVSQGRGAALVRDRIDAINREFGLEGREPLLDRPLLMEEVMSHGENITRRHFFMALSENHNINDRGLTDRIIGNSSPAYIPSGIEMGMLRPFLDRYQVIKVLAHPAAGSFPGESHYKEVLPAVDVVEQFLPEFLDPAVVGIDGLEVYYPGHTKDLESVLLEWAGRYGLLITGGSDCHDSKVRPLGVTGMTRHELDMFMKHMK